MHLHLRTALALLLAADLPIALLAAPQSSATGRPLVLQTSAEMVLVPVTVTDHYGKTVGGLKAQTFTVLDEKIPQQIVSFSTQDAPCSVGLVLDTSGSMRDA